MRGAKASAAMAVVALLAAGCGEESNESAAEDTTTTTTLELSNSEKRACRQAFELADDGIEQVETGPAYQIVGRVYEDDDVSDEVRNAFLAWGDAMMDDAGEDAALEDLREVCADAL